MSIDTTVTVLTTLPPTPPSTDAARPVDGPSDAELEERLRQGSDEAFWTLLHRHHDVIEQRITSLSWFRAHPVEAEEAVMAAADRAWHKRKSFRGNGSFRSWLGTIALRTGLNRVPVREGDGEHRHRRKARTMVAMDAQTEWLAPQQADQERRAIARQVAGLIDHLDPRQRMSVVGWLHGWSDREIARALGYDRAATVASLRFRALRKLRAICESPAVTAPAASA